MSASARRVRSRTDSLSSSLGPASPASDMPSFLGELAERLFVLFPCCPPASRMTLREGCPAGGNR